jgi:hypothetical protein
MEVVKVKSPFRYISDWERFSFPAAECSLIMMIGNVAMAAALIALIVLAALSIAGSQV